jgi:outer membrane lipoprotein SlyB
LCLLPTLPLGVLGWLSTPPGKIGLRTGAVIGGISGALAGGLSGALIGWFGASVEVFGVLVGGISGAVLGVIFQRRLKI